MGEEPTAEGGARRLPPPPLPWLRAQAARSGGAVTDRRPARGWWGGSSPLPRGAAGHGRLRSTLCESPSPPPSRDPAATRPAPKQTGCKVALNCLPQNGGHESIFEIANTSFCYTTITAILNIAHTHIDTATDELPSLGHVQTTATIDGLVDGELSMPSTRCGPNHSCPPTAISSPPLRPHYRPLIPTIGAPLSTTSGSEPVLLFHLERSRSLQAHFLPPQMTTAQQTGTQCSRLHPGEPWGE